MGSGRICFPPSRSASFSNPGFQTKRFDKLALTVGQSRILNVTLDVNASAKVAVDGERELVYYADEECCVRAYKADPDAKNAAVELARFAETGFRANREDIAIAGPYVIVTDKLAPASEYHIYRRTDRKEIANWWGVSESTDGLDAIALPMGPRFPKGFMVAMNSGRHTFQLYPLP